jgi:hypothetical protein
MTLEELIIAAYRVIGSLPVLRWPFIGGIVAILCDLGDLFLMNLLDLGGVRNYQTFDKWLDQVYMLTFLAVTLQWQLLPKTLARGLFAYRTVGFVVFEMTKSRKILFAFPNVFEFWFLWVAGLKFFDLERTQKDAGERRSLLFPYRYSPAQVVAVLGLLTSAKLFQEYVLHYGRWLDGFTAVEAVEAIWDFFTGPLR